MITLNDFFDKIYCINLDSRPDRYKLAINEFSRWGVDVERISGIDGNLIQQNNRFIGKSGAYGLLLTHIEILKNALENRYKNILILEDDVEFIKDFNEKFSEKILMLPDNWDLLYIGGNNVFSRGKFQLISGDENFVITHENYKTLNHEICTTTWTQCAHSLGINSKFYEILLNEINDNMNIPIDTIHCKLQQKKCKAYTFIPSLVLQRPSFSDIEGCYVDYNKNDANGF